jgi:hypothetical protein
VSIRFLADADLNHAIVKGVRGREPALDLMSAAEAHPEGLSDLEVIVFAASQGRILISHDTSTLPTHFIGHLRTGGSSPGVFLVRQRVSCGEPIEALLTIWSASNAAEWVDQIYYLPFFTRHVFRR